MVKERLLDVIKNEPDRDRQNQLIDAAAPLRGVI